MIAATYSFHSQKILVIYQQIILFDVGTMGNEVNGQIPPNEGTLYAIDDKLKPETKITPVSISNGLAWNKENNIFYYIDSPTRQIVAYDYESHTGTICKKLYYMISA